MTETSRPVGAGERNEGRRGFLKNASSAAMASGLAASYGTFAVFAGRFIYPANSAPVGWQYVSTVDAMKVGASLPYVGPTGAEVVIARHGAGTTAEDFIALSSVCPHLGCQVHWEAVNDRFFCPCHNGAFDPQGRPTEGPPKVANQTLTRFPLKVETGLLYIQVPLESVSMGEATEDLA